MNIFFFLTSLPDVKSFLSDLILLNVELSALMSSGKFTIFIKAMATLKHVMGMLHFSNHLFS